MWNEFKNVGLFGNLIAFLKGSWLRAPLGIICFLQASVALLDSKPRI
jgi:hypothetical protein